jgi:NifU-like protein
VDSKPQAHPKLVCYCFLKTAEEIEDEVQRRGLRKPEDVVRFLGAGGGCQTCQPEIRAILDRVWGGGAEASAS